jgi:hypothetical protein
MPDTRGEAPAVSHVRFNWTVISIIAALLTQSVVLVSWAAKLDQRVEALEEKVAAAAGVSETVARIDERTLAMRDALEDLKRRDAGEAARSARR